MKISEYYDLPDFDPNNLSEAKIKHYIDIIKQKYITYWQHTIHHSKCAFHLSELSDQTIPVVLRISLLIKTIQPDQSNTK